MINDKIKKKCIQLLFGDHVRGPARSQQIEEGPRLDQIESALGGWPDRVERAANFEKLLWKRITIKSKYDYTFISVLHMSNIQPHFSYVWGFGVLGLNGNLN